MGKQATVRLPYGEITFTDADVVNARDYVPAGGYSPNRVRPFLLHDHGYTLAVVFADCLQDAIDEAADAGKLDRYRVSEEDMKDYGPEGEGLAFLGNASEPFDLEALGVLELKNPPLSFVAIFTAAQKEEGSKEG